VATSTKGRQLFKGKKCKLRENSGYACELNWRPSEKSGKDEFVK